MSFKYKLPPSFLAGSNLFDLSTQAVTSDILRFDGEKFVPTSGSAGATGATGETGATGATGATGVGLAYVTADQLIATAGAQSVTTDYATVGSAGTGFADDWVTPSLTAGTYVLEFNVSGIRGLGGSIYPQFKVVVDGTATGDDHRFCFSTVLGSSTSRFVKLIFGSTATHAINVQWSNTSWTIDGFTADLQPLYGVRYFALFG